MKRRPVPNKYQWTALKFSQPFWNVRSPALQENEVQAGGPLTQQLTSKKFFNAWKNWSLMHYPFIASRNLQTFELCLSSSDCWHRTCIMFDQTNAQLLKYVKFSNSNNWQFVVAKKQTRKMLEYSLFCML